MKAKKIKRCLQFAIMLMIVINLPICTYAQDNSFETLKYELYSQGILDQSQLKYSQNSRPTRMDVACIFVRLLGEESELKNTTIPFKDVKDNQSLYVGYLYNEGYMRGISADMFGTDKPCGSKLYVYFLLQALGYKQGLDFEQVDSLKFAEGIGLISNLERDKLEKQEFTYEEMLLLTDKTLKQQYKESRESLLEKLEEKGSICTITKKLLISNKKDQEASIELENRKVKLNKICGKEYKYIWMQFENATTKEVKKCDIVLIGDKETLIEIPNLPNGDFYLNLFVSKDRYSTYNGLYWREILIRVEDDKVEGFIPSPVLISNKQVQLNQSNMRGIELTNSERKNPEIIALAEGITKEKMNDYDKALAIHDWVANNIYYDYDAYYDRAEAKVSAIEVLKDKRSVCQGYANLTSALMEAVNIPCHVVGGYALGLGTDGSWDAQKVLDLESNHAWNEAYIDGRWIIMDVTWDSDNEYENGSIKSDKGLRSYKYFDPSIELFSYNHQYIVD